MHGQRRRALWFSSRINEMHWLIFYWWIWIPSPILYEGGWIIIFPKSQLTTAYLLQWGYRNCRLASCYHPSSHQPCPAFIHHIGDVVSWKVECDHVVWLRQKLRQRLCTGTHWKSVDNWYNYLEARFLEYCLSVFPLSRMIRPFSTLRVHYKGTAFASYTTHYTTDIFNRRWSFFHCWIRSFSFYFQPSWACSAIQRSRISCALRNCSWALAFWSSYPMLGPIEAGGRESMEHWPSEVSTPAPRCLRVPVKSWC